MDSTSFFIQYAPITDWVQAFGAVIAIVAGVWGFITLFKKDENKEKQINSLIELSKENKRQADAMWQLYRQNVVSRLNDIKPEFVYKDRNTLGINYEIVLVNKGKGFAKNITFETIKTNIEKIVVKIHESAIINSNENLELLFTFKINSHLSVFLDATIKFQDQDGTEYEQNLKVEQWKVYLTPPKNKLWDINSYS